MQNYTILADTLLSWRRNGDKSTSERVLCAFARSGFPVRVRYRFLPSVAPIRKNRRNSSDLAYGPRSRSGGSAFFCFWFPVVGVQWTTATVPAPARVAAGDPRFGGFFFGLQPSIFRPLGRTVEGSPACRNRGFPAPGFRFFGKFYTYPQTPQTPKRYPCITAPVLCLDRLGTVWGGLSSPNGPVWGVWTVWGVCAVCTVWTVWAVWGFSVC